jgi:hypothetical protein
VNLIVSSYMLLQVSTYGSGARMALNCITRSYLCLGNLVPGAQNRGPCRDVAPSGYVDRSVTMNSGYACREASSASVSGLSGNTAFTVWPASTKLSIVGCGSSRSDSTNSTRYAVGATVAGSACGEVDPVPSVAAPLNFTFESSATASLNPEYSVSRMFPEQPLL